MFADRTKGDVNSANYGLVLENAAHLDKVFAVAKPYLEGILADPSKQLKTPSAFDPGKLKAADGYFRVDDRPVFLWGPCTF